MPDDTDSDLEILDMPKCPHCNKAFASVEEHVKNCGVERQVCKRCNHDFSSTVALKVHQEKDCPYIIWVRFM